MRRFVLGGLTLLVLGAAAIAATQPAAPNPGGRPRDPWVFRCVLDQRPRMVVIALHENLWVAYDATTCSLYKAWKGDVKFQGAVYDHVHGPQPVVRGQPMVDEIAEPWIVRRNGNDIECEFHWKGYRIQHDQVTLLYQIQLEVESSIDVEEQVEAVAADAKTISLQRQFTTANVPTGVTLLVPTAARQPTGETMTVTVNDRVLKGDDASAALLPVTLAPNSKTVIASRFQIPSTSPDSATEGRRGAK